MNAVHRSLQRSLGRNLSGQNHASVNKSSRVKSTRHALKICVYNKPLQQDSATSQQPSRTTTPSSLVEAPLVPTSRISTPLHSMAKDNNIKKLKIKVKPDLQDEGMFQHGYTGPVTPQKKTFKTEGYLADSDVDEYQRTPVKEDGATFSSPHATPSNPTTPLSESSKSLHCHSFSASSA